jgi:hypothetical protein
MAGYRSYHSGKWHIDGKVLASGFVRSLDMRIQGNFFSPRGNLVDDVAVSPTAGHSNTRFRVLLESSFVAGYHCIQVRPIARFKLADWTNSSSKFCKGPLTIQGPMLIDKDAKQGRPSDDELLQQWKHQLFSIAI